MDKQKVNKIINKLTFNTTFYERFVVYFLAFCFIFIIDFFGGKISDNIGWFMLPAFVFELVISFIRLYLNWKNND